MRHLLTLTAALLGVVVRCAHSAQNCTPIYIRWPRVRLTFRPRVQGAYASLACQRACTTEEHPSRAGYPLACAGYNHRTDPTNVSNDCQIYQSDQLQNVDGFAEADDRYSFFWKYCVKADKICQSDYQFTFFTDRYMDRSEVARVIYTNTLEQCLGKCLDEQQFACRSTSFNRTDGACHLSAQNQLSKPKLIRCAAPTASPLDIDTFTFDHECRPTGILVKVTGQVPYTGALYGLYDYFKCRTLPQEQTNFSYFFPFPSESNNCADSMRPAENSNDIILEVVLSTDGVEPLYFITPEDLTYQARCPYNNGTADKKLIRMGDHSIDGVTSTRREHDTTTSINSTQSPRIGDPIDTGRTNASANDTNGAHSSDLRLPPSSAEKYENVEPELVGWDKGRQGSRISVHFSLPGFGDNTTTNAPTNSRARDPLTVTSKSVQYLTLPTVSPSTTTSTSSATLASQRVATGIRITQTDVSTTSTSTTTTSTTTSTPTSTPTITTTSTVASIANTTTAVPPRPILFDIFNGGTPVDAVVVGTRVTLSFTPYYAIPPVYMTIGGCQVEPVESLFEWEREPLPIIKNGCQADSVGLVCPPERTDFGIRTKVEAFRYQTTAQVVYTCLVRVCPHAPCPQPFCAPVEGCASSGSVITSSPFRSPTFFSSRGRWRRQAWSPNFLATQSLLNSANNSNAWPPPQRSFDQAQAAQLAAALQQAQFGGGTLAGVAPPPPAVQQHLDALAGDHVVTKRLIVMNSENELQYYLRTGSIPTQQLLTTNNRPQVGFTRRHV